MAKPSLRWMLATVVFCLGMASAQASDGNTDDAPDPSSQEWRFRVLLDDKDIGYHRFRVTGQDERQRVEIEASFDVRFLFFNAYSYRHENVEQWKGDCLEEIRSTTRAGRDQFQVSGVARADRFALETLNDEYTLETDCARTFAYWDPLILDSTRLLNAQTGEWIDVAVSEAGFEELEILGRRVSAQRFDLSLPDGTISLWYGTGGAWLALEAPAPGGRVLKYLPEQLPAGFDLDTRLVRR